MSFRSTLAKPFPYFAALATLGMVALLALCLWSILQQRGVPTQVGWSPRPQGDSWFIDHVNPAGPAAGRLQAGDRIVSLNGSQRAARFGPSRITFTPTSPYSIEVERSGRIIAETLPTRAAPTWRYPSYFLLGLLNFALAVAIALSRPDYVVAQVAFFCFLGMARTFTSVCLTGFGPAGSGLGLWIALLFDSYIWSAVQWAVSLDFFLRFPEPLRQPRLFRLFRWLFYALAGCLFLVSLLTVLPDLLGLAGRSSLLPAWFPLRVFDQHKETASDLLGASALLLAPFILARNYRLLPDAVSRRRVRWAALGIGLSMVPIALGITALAVFQALGSYSAYESVEVFLDNFAALFSCIAPIALAYAIIKHRVLGIRVVVRKGLQYLLASNVLRLLLWLPVIAISLDVIAHPRRPIVDFFLNRSWWFYLFLIVSVSATLRYRHRLQTWVDRKFFRSAYEEEVILSELVDAMQGCESSDEVASTVSEKLQQGLQPSSVSVLYQKGPSGLFTVGYPRDEPIGLEYRGILNERVQDALQSQRSARTFTEIAALLKDERTTSNDLIMKTLVTPITGSNGQLLGVLLLGQKRSEQSYSPRDRRLLQAIAIQMGLVFEMLSLKEQVREEGRVRVEVLGKLDQDSIQLVLECPKCGACYTKPATHCEFDSCPLGMTLPIERIVDGKYRLERRIGTGGMGAVYEASDLRLDRIVAIKVMTGRLFGNTSALRRFEREARAAARLQHPNIVAVYDFGSLHGGGAYLVMQRVSGHSWRAELNRAGHIRPKRAAPWFNQLCDAIGCAHSQGIVHRDLKPENLLLSVGDDGLERVSVLDFGVAKLRDADGNPEPMLTSIDRVIGTYGYMSPEQRAGSVVDHRSDIYAVAVIAVETLTNNRPPSSGVSGEWPREALHWKAQTTDCEALVQLLGRALHESPRERPSNIYDLRQDLVSLLDVCPPPLISAAAGSGGDDTETMPV
jgi:eukaryotic-like serine/threonine-protein kinase